MHVGLFASDHRYSASLIREVQRRLLHAFDPELDAQRPAFRVAQLVNVVNHYVALSGPTHVWRYGPLRLADDAAPPILAASPGRRGPRAGGGAMSTLLGNLKRNASPAAKTWLLRSGACGAIRRALPNRGLSILRYHAICSPDAGYASRDICISPEAFERQVAYLAERYTVVSLPEAVKALREKEALGAERGGHYV